MMESTGLSFEAKESTEGLKYLLFIPQTAGEGKKVEVKEKELVPIIVCLHDYGMLHNTGARESKNNPFVFGCLF